MVVFGALKESESEQRVSAERVFGKHTLDSQLHRLGGLGRHEDVVAGFFEMTDIAGVTLPLLLGQLVAGQNSILAVDNNHMVAAVYIGSKGGLVLASTYQARSTSVGFAKNVDIFIPPVLFRAL